MSNTSCEDARDFYTIERGKSNNNASTKNVLFATGVEKSSSLYMLNEQLPTTLSNPNPITTTSTSQLIKQSLSPLVHRNIQQNTPKSTNDSNVITNQHRTKPNSVSIPLDNYQFSSNTFITNSNKSNSSKNNFSLSTSIDVSNTLIENTSSPSRSLNNHTNTLPSHVGRSNYQFESNCLLKNKPKTVTSPGKTTFFNALNSISSSNASATSISQTLLGVSSSVSTSPNFSNTSFSSNHIYSTLPKTTNSISNTNTTSNIYGNVSAVANEFEQLIARNATGNNSVNSSISNVSNNHGNYNTLGSYRVQYSSTNPFLNNFNFTDLNVSSENRMSEGQ